MSRADMQTHPVKFGKLLFERCDDAGQAGEIWCRWGSVFQG
jgi:hypothetical protein